MRLKSRAGCLFACLGVGSFLLSGTFVSADDVEIVTDQIVELREAMGDSSSADAATFKEAVRQAAAKATVAVASDKAKTCAKDCDLCPGECDKCPVEGCASCAAAAGEEPLSCCTGKLPSRVSVTSDSPSTMGRNQRFLDSPMDRIVQYAQPQESQNWGTNQLHQPNRPSAPFPPQPESYNQWNPPPSSRPFQPNPTRPLYESAFSLEQIAHRLEMQNMLDEADRVRQAAVELRRSARERTGK